jgi:hypothetical protein
MASDILSICSRPYAELVAASYSRNDVPNNHLSSGNTIPEASSAQNVVRNNQLPLGGTAPVASSAQNGVLNGHLSSDNNVTDNVVCSGFFFSAEIFEISPKTGFIGDHRYFLIPNEIFRYS